MDDFVLQEWGQKADELASNLEKLAQEPSERNLAIAQMSLRSFRRKFPRWIADNKAISTYQKEVWENRLKTLDRLLKYGDIKQLWVGSAQ